jgi:nucleoside-diphosphate-sugar epimerase
MFNGAGDRMCAGVFQIRIHPLLTLCCCSVLDAGTDVLAYILCAGGVFADRPGMGSYGVFNRLYSNNAKQLGYTPYIGDGSAVMALLHVDDVVAALLKVLALATDPASETRSATAESRWYNAGGMAVQWKTIAEVYGKALGLNTKQVAADQAGFMAG